MGKSSGRTAATDDVFQGRRREGIHGIRTEGKELSCHRGEGRLWSHATPFCGILRALQRRSGMHNAHSGIVEFLGGERRDFEMQGLHGRGGSGKSSPSA